MYGPMSKIRDYYANHPMINEWNSFVIPNIKHHFYPPIMEIEKRVHPPLWGNYHHPQMAFGSQYTQGYQPFIYQSSQGYPKQQVEHHSQHPTNNPSYSQIVFHNPLFSQEENNIQQTNPVYQDQQPYFHPYPKASFLVKPPSGVQNVLNSFKSQDGTLDINKMVDTAGQMINAVSQVSSVVKGLGGIFKV